MAEEVDTAKAQFATVHLLGWSQALPQILPFFCFGCRQAKWLGEMRHFTNNKASFDRKAVEFRILYWRVGGGQQSRRPCEKR